MFTQHLIKNCLWLLAAVQCFSPPQLSRFLVVVMTTFILQISFVNGVFAEDVATTTATDTPIVSTDSTALESVILQDPPSIDMLNTTEGLRIVISAIPTGMMSKYYFDGSDVTSLIAEMVDSGVIKISEENGSNVMLVSLAQPFLGEHSFAVEIVDGTLVSKKVVLTQPILLDKWSLGSGVKGYVYSGCNWWSYLTSSTKAASGKTVTVKLKGTGLDSTIDKTVSILTDTSGLFEYIADRLYTSTDATIYIDRTDRGTKRIKRNVVSFGRICI